MNSHTSHTRGLAENLAFGLTALWFKARDKFVPPANILGEVEIREGFSVLDYGCGPGSFTLLAAERVGPSGRVYAADINPLALRHVRRVAAKRGPGNIKVIHTCCATGLESGSVDVALPYDTYHDLEDPARVLEELHRVLKRQGLLSQRPSHAWGRDPA